MALTAEEQAELAQLQALSVKTKQTAAPATGLTSAEQAELAQLQQTKFGGLKSTPLTPEQKQQALVRQSEAEGSDRDRALFNISKDLLNPNIELNQARLIGADTFGLLETLNQAGIFKDRARRSKVFNELKRRGIPSEFIKTFTELDDATGFLAGLKSEAPETIGGIGGGIIGAVLGRGNPAVQRRAAAVGAGIGAGATELGRELFERQFRPERGRTFGDLAKDTAFTAATESIGDFLGAKFIEPALGSVLRKFAGTVVPGAPQISKELGEAGRQAVDLPSDPLLGTKLPIQTGISRPLGAVGLSKKVSAELTPQQQTASKFISFIEGITQDAFFGGGKLSKTKDIAQAAALPRFIANNVDDISRKLDVLSLDEVGVIVQDALHGSKIQDQVGVRVFRSGEAVDLSKISDRGLPLTTDKSVAETFLKSKEINRIQFASAGVELPDVKLESFVINPDAKIATKADIPKDIFDAYRATNPVVTPEKGEILLGKWAKREGFDGLDFRTLGRTSKAEAEIKIYNPNVLVQPTATRGASGIFKTMQRAMFGNVSEKIPGTIDISGAQVVAQRILEQAEPGGKRLGLPEGTKAALQKLVATGSQKNIDDLIFVRSDIGDLVRAAELSGEGKAKQVLDGPMTELTNIMNNAAKKAGAFNELKLAMKFSAEGKQRLQSNLIRKLAVSKTPSNKVVRAIFGAPGDETLAPLSVVRNVKDALLNIKGATPDEVVNNKFAWDQLRFRWLESNIARASKGGVGKFGESFDRILTNFGDDALETMFSKAELEGIRKIGLAGQLVGKKARAVGANLVRVAQLSSGGFAAASGKESLALLALGGPAVMGEFLTSPAGRKLLTTGISKGTTTSLAGIQGQFITGMLRAKRSQKKKLQRMQSFEKRLVDFGKAREAAGLSKRRLAAKEAKSAKQRKAVRGTIRRGLVGAGKAQQQRNIIRFRP
jgi:hypothetical protein